jgi:8-oxo-dGTP pyrophosphatase MutT (NUDIX family)
MWKYCPACGSPGIRFDGTHKFSCPGCGFVYYHNTAAATGCVIRSKQGLVFLVRGKEPARGKLDLPGGFVDPGEGAAEGLLRELREEIGWEAPLAGAAGGTIPKGLSLFASFPNLYPYRGIPYNTCDLFFTLDAPGLTRADLRLQAREIGGVRFIRPEELKLDELAFDSTRRALRAWLDLYAKPRAAEGGDEI